MSTRRISDETIIKQINASEISDVKTRVFVLGCQKAILDFEKLSQEKEKLLQLRTTIKKEKRSDVEIDYLNKQIDKVQSRYDKSKTCLDNYRADPMFTQTAQVFRRKPDFDLNWWAGPLDKTNSYTPNRTSSENNKSDALTHAYASNPKVSIDDADAEGIDKISESGKAWVCWKCHTKNLMSDKMCWHCGKPFDGGNHAYIEDETLKSSHDQKSDDTSRPGKIALFAGLALIILVIILCCCLKNCNKPSKDNEKSQSDTSYVVVEKIEFSQKEVTLEVGQLKKLDYIVTPKEAYANDVCLKSSNYQIVDVSGLTVTALAPGQAVIDLYNSDECFGQCIITVSDIEPQKIQLESSSFEGKIGRTIEIPLILDPPESTDKEITVEVEDAKIAQFVNGQLCGVSSGSTNVVITHKNTGLSITGTVTVSPVELEALKIDIGASVAVGSEHNLSVIATPSDATDQSVKWTTSDKSVAAINDNNVLIAKKAGKVTITATAKSGVFAEKEIDVVAVMPKAITVKCTTGDKLKVGDKAILSVSFNPTNTTDQSVIWSSSDSKVVSVDSKGNITANSPGKATITAKACNGVSAQYTFTVNTAPVNVSNGFIKRPSGYLEAPVTVHASKDESCYVYFKSTTNKKHDFSLFVKAGTTVDVDAPVDTYIVYYASGTIWYGEKYRFGVGTSYYKADSKFNFYYFNGYVYGTELTLYKVAGGNLGTTKIDEEDFPG